VGKIATTTKRVKKGKREIGPRLKISQSKDREHSGHREKRKNFFWKFFLCVHCVLSESQ